MQQRNISVYQMDALHWMASALDVQKRWRVCLRTIHLRIRVRIRLHARVSEMLSGEHAVSGPSSPRSALADRVWRLRTSGSTLLAGDKYAVLRNVAGRHKPTEEHALRNAEAVGLSLAIVDFDEVGEHKRWHTRGNLLTAKVAQPALSLIMPRLAEQPLHLPQWQATGGQRPCRFFLFKLGLNLGCGAGPRETLLPDRLSCAVQRGGSDILTHGGWASGVSSCPLCLVVRGVAEQCRMGIHTHAWTVP